MRSVWRILSLLAALGLAAASARAESPTPTIGLERPDDFDANWGNKFRNTMVKLDNLASGRGLFANRPTCATSYQTKLFSVTDCIVDVNGDCTGGTGDPLTGIRCVMRCKSDGAAWETVVCGGTGGGDNCDGGDCDLRDSSLPTCVVASDAGGNLICTPADFIGPEKIADTGVYDVREYGVVPHGVFATVCSSGTDATAAIDALLDTLRAKAETQAVVVFFPEGYYRLEAPIDLSGPDGQGKLQPITLRGVGSREGSTGHLSGSVLVNCGGGGPTVKIPAAHCKAGASAGKYCIADNDCPGSVCISEPGIVFIEDLAIECETLATGIGIECESGIAEGGARNIQVKNCKYGFQVTDPGCFNFDLSKSRFQGGDGAGNVTMYRVEPDASSSGLLSMLRDVVFRGSGSSTDTCVEILNGSDFHCDGCFFESCDNGGLSLRAADPHIENSHWEGGNNTGGSDVYYRPQLCQTCSGGADAGKLCNDDGDCSGGTCPAVTCGSICRDSQAPDYTPCTVDGDCTEGCVGGTDAGEACLVASDCGGGGTCTAGELPGRCAPGYCQTGTYAGGRSCNAGATTFAINNSTLSGQHASATGPHIVLDTVPRGVVTANQNRVDRIELRQNVFSPSYTTLQVAGMTGGAGSVFTSGNAPLTTHWCGGTTCSATTAYNGIVCGFGDLSSGQTTPECYFPNGVVGVAPSFHLAVNDTTPSVLASNMFRTQNSGSTTITQFDDGAQGRTVTIYATDANTIIAHNSNIDLVSGANFTMAIGDVLTLFQYDANKWVEVARNPAVARSLALAADPANCGGETHADGIDTVGVAQCDADQWADPVVDTPGDVLAPSTVAASECVAVTTTSGSRACLCTDAAQIDRFVIDTTCNGFDMRDMVFVGASSKAWLGIGTPARVDMDPLAPLDVEAEGQGQMALFTAYLTSGNPTYLYRLSNGLRGAEGVPASGKNLMLLSGAGWTGSDFSGASGFFGLQATETWAASATGTRAVIGTVANGGTSLLERLWVDHDGQLVLKEYTTAAGDFCNGVTSPQILGVDTSDGSITCTTNDDIPDAADYTNLLGGAGIGHAVTGTLTTASGETDFLASGALTCTTAQQGRMQIHTTPLQYCDNAGTPTLRYAAYGDSSGNATGVACGSACVSPSEIDQAAAYVWTGDQDFRGFVTLDNQVPLILNEADGNGADFVAHQAAASLTGDITMEWGNDLQTCATGEVIEVASVGGGVVVLECDVDSVDTAANYTWTGTHDFSGGKLLPQTHATACPAADCDAAAEEGRLCADLDAASGHGLMICDGTAWTEVLGSGGYDLEVKGDSGTTEEITDAETLTIGTSTVGIDTVGQGPNTIMVDLDLTELDTPVFNNGSGSTTMEWQIAGGPDPLVAFADFGTGASIIWSNTEYFAVEGAGVVGLDLYTTGASSDGAFVHVWDTANDEGVFITGRKVTWYEAGGGGAGDGVTLIAPASLAASYTLTWPTADAAGVMVSDGAGALSLTASPSLTNVTLTGDLLHAGEFDIGSASTDLVRINTDGTGNGEVVLPAGSIGASELSPFATQQRHFTGIDCDDNTAEYFGDTSTCNTTESTVWITPTGASTTFTKLDCWMTGDTTCTLIITLRKNGVATDLTGSCVNQQPFIDTGSATFNGTSDTLSFLADDSGDGCSGSDVFCTLFW